VMFQRLCCRMGWHRPPREHRFARDGQDRLILAKQCEACGEVLSAGVLTERERR
jgi:hypothetical protein